jgi:hypothetical protein
MSTSDTVVRAQAVITVHKYKPAAYDEPAGAKLGEGAQVHLDHWFE